MAGSKQATKRTRSTSMTVFFNFSQTFYDPSLKHPCESPLLRKLFRVPNPVRWDFLEEKTVDEIFFKIPKVRDRLRVELMARGGLRVSEALKLTPRDVEDRRRTLRAPKRLRTRAPRDPTTTGSAEVKARTATGLIFQSRDPRLPLPGTLLAREFQGHDIVVKVLDNGFECDGRHHKSLSAIAQEVTGSKRNGFLFLPRTVKGRDPIRKKDLLSFAAVPHWECQRKMWKLFLRQQMPRSMSHLACPFSRAHRPPFVWRRKYLPKGPYRWSIIPPSSF